MKPLHLPGYGQIQDLHILAEHAGKTYRIEEDTQSTLVVPYAYAPEAPRAEWESMPVRVSLVYDFVDDRPAAWAPLDKDRAKSVLAGLGYVT